MSGPWAHAGAPEAGEQGAVLMEGTTFCTGDRLGNLGEQRASGLFVRDTRVLRTWRLSLEGRRLQALRLHQEAPYSATFVAFSPTPGAPADAGVLLSRDRWVGDGMREDLTVRNATATPVRVELRLQVEADFADLFEVKDVRDLPARDVLVSTDGDELHLSTVRAGEEYAVSVVPAPGAVLDHGGVRWVVELAGHGTWRTTLQVVPRLRGRRLVPHHLPGTPVEHAAPARRQRQFRGSAPRLATGDPVLAAALGRSIEDLATLRIFDPERPDLAVVAAGAPWFMALFGRDSLITSMMLLPVDSTLALGTLTTLAAHLGTTTDPVTEEQPGRVPHELRFGPAGTLALGGRNAYYGSADATPLFVMALGQLAAWAPDLLDQGLVQAADQALEWMLHAGDRDGDGLIEYQRATPEGLMHQGWKDSWDGIGFADGTPAQPPIALVEVQAYAYAAFRARADIADLFDDDAGAARWRAQAARLQVTVNDAFWLPDRGWYAVALDRDKRPVDALTSNAGHCLWTGIADDDKAAQVAEHLLSPEMFTGWGIRTLSTRMGAFNPMSYHNGSVWPHDTALCVSGLLRYGHVAAAQEVALGLVDASASFGGRLPELFAGFDRQQYAVPVPYPAACSPQAWAAAAPLELLRSLLGLEPTADGMTCRPVLPERLLPLRLSQVPCRGARYDVEVDGHGWRVERCG